MNDICSIPIPVVGPCTDYEKMYYFNVHSNRCQDFIWGGCKCTEYNHIHKHKENRFKDLAACQKSCLPPPPPPPAPPAPAAVEGAAVEKKEENKETKKTFK
jgi:hypothetical protein